MAYKKASPVRQFLDELGNAFDAADMVLPSEFELKYQENRDPAWEQLTEEDIEELITLREEFEVFWEHFNVFYARATGMDD